MSDENIADRKYTADTEGAGSPMPGSWVAGNGEMGASLDESPVFDAGDAGSAGNPNDGRGNNVTGAGTGQMIDTDADTDDEEDLGGGATGTGVGGYGAGYGGGMDDEMPGGDMSGDGDGSSTSGT